jgi:hypothetical protein
MCMVLHRRPRAALRAAVALIALNDFGAVIARMTELARTGKPGVAAGAVKLLEKAQLARRRYRDGRGHML